MHSPRWVCWLWPWRRTHGAVAHASSHAWPAGADQRTCTPAGGCNRSAGGQRRAEGQAVQTRDALPPLKRATQRCNRTPAHLPSDAIAMCGLAGRHLAREGCWHGEAHKVPCNLSSLSAVGLRTWAHHAPWLLARRPPSVQVLAGGWNAGQVVVVGATCLGCRV